MSSSTGATRRILINGEIREIPVPARPTPSNHSVGTPTGTFASRNIGSEVTSVITRYKILWKCLAFFTAVIVVGRMVSVHLSAVMVLAMGFYLMFTNFSGPRKPGELSAYSVFNPGNQRLTGQLTASQFEAEMRGMPVQGAKQD